MKPTIEDLERLSEEGRSFTILPSGEVKRGDSEFQAELELLINRFSKENESDTPDFILAKYLAACLASFNEAVGERERWYGRPGPSGAGG